MSKRVAGLLPQVSFSILFALSLRPRHGYELMKQVDEDSAGKIKLGPGALYGAIKQLHEDGLIEELPRDGDRRRYYQLTKRGQAKLGSEMEYFRNTVRLAENRPLLGHERQLGAAL
jgi:DNA-binding PadR family transcriptional regulator